MCNQSASENSWTTLPGYSRQPARLPVLDLTVMSFWVRAASVGSRLGFCALFMMFVCALFVGLGFRLRRCWNFCAAALAGAGPWYIAGARLSRTGVAGLPTARVARRLRRRQGAAKHNRTN